MGSLEWNSQTNKKVTTGSTTMMTLLSREARGNTVGSVAGWRAQSGVERRMKAGGAAVGDGRHAARSFVRADRARGECVGMCESWRVLALLLPV